MSWLNRLRERRKFVIFGLSFWAWLTLTCGHCGSWWRVRMIGRRQAWCDWCWHETRLP